MRLVSFSGSNQQPPEQALPKPNNARERWTGTHTTSPGSDQRITASSSALQVLQAFAPVDVQTHLAPACAARELHEPNVSEERILSNPQQTNHKNAEEVISKTKTLK